MKLQEHSKIFFCLFETKTRLFHLNNETSLMLKIKKTSDMEKKELNRKNKNKLNKYIDRTERFIHLS